MNQELLAGIGVDHFVLAFLWKIKSKKENINFQRNTTRQNNWFAKCIREN